MHTARHAHACAGNPATSTSIYLNCAHQLFVVCGKSALCTRQGEARNWTVMVASNFFICLISSLFIAWR